MKIARIDGLKPLDYAGTEALNTVCTNMSFSGRNLKKILMTSCDAGDGKSYMTMYIAQNMAKRGKRVIVVDADLRRSAMVKRYAVSTENEWVGLAHYLAGYNKLDEVVYQTNLDGLYILPIGRHVANPIPLLNTNEFAGMLDILAEKFDLVLVDAPPVGVVIDAAEMAQFCDGSILVVSFGDTRRRVLKTVKRQMEQSGCPIIGCVINKVTFDSLSSKKYYNYGYGYGYGYGYKYGKEYAVHSDGRKKSGK